MDVVLALLFVLVPIAAIAAIPVLLIRRSLKRRARDRAQGTFRTPSCSRPSGGSSRSSGERVDYQPFFVGKRPVWAMDAVRAETQSDQRMSTFYVKGRDGRAAPWSRSVIPPRTVAAFQHGAHHNAVETDKNRRIPLIGMAPFTIDASLELPDGTTATWRGDRTVELDVLVSTLDEALLRAVEN